MKIPGLAAMAVILILSFSTGRGAPVDKRVVVAGSSVPKGVGTLYAGSWFDNFNGDGTNDDYAIYGYANRLREILTEPVNPSEPPLGPGNGMSTTAWSFRNVSIAGNNAAALRARFAADVAAQNPEYVLLALSMGNEGLAETSDPDNVMTTYRDGMLDLIQKSRNIGAVPVIGLVYPKNTYTLQKYDYVRRMNLLMNTWGVPAINLLGATDDGRGRWARGFFYDEGHPNTPGHEEMSLAIPPTLFPAIESGKTAVPSFPSGNGFLRLTRDASQPAPVAFTPGDRMHAFNTSFRVRANSPGTVAAVRAKSQPGVLLDFGPSDDANGRATAGPDAFGRYWNSWRPTPGGANTIGNGTAMSNLVDVGNNPTGIGVTVTWPFRGANGRNSGGLLTPAEAQLGQLAVDTATEDYFYVESGVNSGFGVFKITGLDPAKTYTLRVFGSRAATDTRTTRYTLKSGLPYEHYAFLSTSGNNTASDGLADGNDDSVALFANVPPDSSGAIEVIISVETGTFGYLGLMELSLDEAAGRFGTVEVRDSSIAYVSPSGAEISHPIDGDGGLWHEVALSHRFAAQQTLLYVDGVLAGTLRESLEPDQFILGGSGSAGNDSPLVADYQDWCVHRAAWTADEALAQHAGSLQHASLEILAPLDDAAFSIGSPVANTAQSLSQAILQIANAQPVSGSGSPTELTGRSPSKSRIELDWQDNSLSESGFVIQRRQSNTGEAWADIAQPAANQESFTDTGLARGVSYDYRIAAVESGGLRSAWSNIFTHAAGANSSSFRAWSGGYFALTGAVFRVDFNTDAAATYGGEIWNRVGSLTDPGPYLLRDTNNDSSAGYSLTLTDGFDQFRSGNGNATLAGYPAAAQSTFFAVTDQKQPGGAQFVLSGLDPEATYAVSIFARRDPVLADFDYTGRYTLNGSGTPVTCQLGAGQSTQFMDSVLKPDSAGNIVVTITGQDTPTAKVFAGISFLVLKELGRLPPSGSFLLDLNSTSSPSYPAGQTWNQLASTGDLASHPFVDRDGSTAAGLTYQVTSAFSDVRSDGSIPSGSFAPAAESTLFRAANAGSVITFSGLDPARTYQIIFLARRGTTVAGFDYSGNYTASGNGTASASVDAAVGGFHALPAIAPTSGGNLTFTVEAGSGTGTDFPMLNLVILVPAASGSIGAGAGDDPDGDELPNYLEYAMGTNPLVASGSSLSLSAPGMVGDNFSITYSRGVGARDVVFTVETTTDLATPSSWQTDPLATESLTSDDGLLETIQILRPLGADPRRFFRLRTTYTPE